MLNKKIKNATKQTQDWITFDSKLELYCYNKLKENNIPFQLKYKFVSVNKFKYRWESIREISHFPDFFLYEHNIILDTKWRKNDVYPIKTKLLKKYLMEQWTEYKIVTVQTQKEVNEFVNKLICNNTLK